MGRSTDLYVRKRTAGNCRKRERYRTALVELTAGCGRYLRRDFETVEVCKRNVNGRTVQALDRNACIRRFFRKRKHEMRVAVLNLQQVRNVRRTRLHADARRRKLFQFVVRQTKRNVSVFGIFGKIRKLSLLVCAERLRVVRSPLKRKRKSRAFRIGAERKRADLAVVAESYAANRNVGTERFADRIGNDLDICLGNRSAERLACLLELDFVVVILRAERSLAERYPFGAFGNRFIRRGVHVIRNYGVRLPNVARLNVLEFRLECARIEHCAFISDDRARGLRVETEFAGR